MGPGELNNSPKTHMDRSQRKAIGNAVRKARNSLELTQADAAEEINVSVEFYARIERGSAAPSLDTLLRMATVFRTSTDNLLGLTADETAQRMIEKYTPSKPKDPPELRRLFRRLRAKQPRVIKFIQTMLHSLDRYFPNNGDHDVDDSGDDSSDD